MRVQWPQYCGHVDSSSANTFVGYRCVSPSTFHISASCSESRDALGWFGQSVRRSSNAGSMYRRSGSDHRSSNRIVFSMCGVMSSDIVARSF